MRPLDLDLIRLYVHLLAATTWVGGQIVLAGLVPTLRSAGPDVPRAAARAFNPIAWGAFAVLVVTGIWNVVEIDVAEQSLRYQVTLFAKLAVVAVSGIGAALHAGARSKVVLAVGGGLSALGGLVALFLGLWLHG